MIYVEEEILSHPRALQIRSRFPDAEVVPCARYGEIFNRRAQSFRLQKRRPSLILARKHRNFVHEAPKGFGIAGAKSFRFSHMLNCIYDCRYCFLQGMYRSAHYVIFVNYEDFQWEIEETIRGVAGGPLWFFSGYDCDSLALEPVTRFAASFVPFFSRFPQASLELRTKSTQIKTLLEMDAVPNVVVAWSLTPEEVQASYEHLTPAIDRRLRAMERLEERGWKLGLRFDPLIYNEDYQDQYRRLFRQVFSALRPESLHSVSLGPFRLTQDFFKTLVRLYPEDPLFAAPFEEEAQVSYRRDLEAEMVEFCTEELLRHIPRELFEPGFSVAPSQPVVSGPASPAPSL
ncbi:MAG TPA: DNA photolyase [Thermoanaerobaculia bacterium]|nr:DNA photolyase [Thermoanaerobaculia bacterium]